MGSSGMWRSRPHGGVVAAIATVITQGQEIARRGSSHPRPPR